MRLDEYELQGLGIDPANCEPWPAQTESQGKQKMRLRVRFRKLTQKVGLMAIAVAATMNTVGHAQQPVADTATQADSIQPMTFEYLFFWKENDTRTQNALTATQQELGKLGKNVSLKQIGIKDPANAEAVEFYGVSRAPMPLVLCMASNGAVTKAFVTPFAAAQLGEGIVSRGTADTLKAIQDNKLVVLCALNSDSVASSHVLYSAQSLKTDERFGNSVEVIAVDVRDSNEASLLAGMKLDSSMAEPTIVILAPPGKQLATLTGKVSTEQIAAKLVAAQSACCPGGQCGPGAQCCPGGKCAPPKK